VALLVCLIPTTIGGLLSRHRRGRMSRMMASNVIATSGRAVEAAAMVEFCCSIKRHHHLGQSPGCEIHPGEGVTDELLGHRRN